MANYQPDSVYFKQRAEQEALAATQATTARAREAHSVIARRYFELGQAFEIYDTEPKSVTEKAKAQGRTAA